MNIDFLIAVSVSASLLFGFVLRIGWSAAFSIAAAYFSLYLLIARDK